MGVTRTSKRVAASKPAAPQSVESVRSRTVLPTRCYIFINQSIKVCSLSTGPDDTLYCGHAQNANFKYPFFKYYIS